MIALALVLNGMSENHGSLKWWWLGVFIAPTTKPTVGEAACRWTHQTVRCATRHCPVHQPRHPIVRVLTVSAVGALHLGAPDGPVPHRTVRCHTGQSLFTVRCAFWRCSDSTRTVRTLFTFAGDRWSRQLRWEPLLRLVQRTVQWHNGQSGEL